MKLAPLALLAFLTITGGLYAQDKAGKSDKAEKRAETGKDAEKVSAEALEAAVRMIDSRNIDDQMVKAMVQGFEGLEIDKELKAAMLKEFTTEKNLTSLKTMMAEVYARQLSVEDLNALTAFYSTPAGKRISAAEGDITVEAMKAGQKWGQELGEKIGREFEKKKREAEESF